MSSIHNQLGSQSKGNNQVGSLVSTFLTSLGVRNNTCIQKEQDSDRLDEELACPICQDLMKDVYVTSCGHSFCHACIAVHLENQSDCPLCRSKLDIHELYPNFQLNKLAESRIRISKEKAENQKESTLERLIQQSKQDPHAFAKSIAELLSIEEIENVFKTAMEQKKQEMLDRDLVQKDLLYYFLTLLTQRNSEALDRLIQERACIKEDVDYIRRNHVSRKRKLSELYLTDNHPAFNDTNSTEHIKKEIKEQPCSIDPDHASLSHQSMLDRMQDRFDDIQYMYHDILKSNQPISKRHKLLSDLSSTLYDLTRYSQFQSLDTFYYADCNKTPSSIVSSIEFDRDQEFVAAGGVTREIKLFDFNMMHHQDNQIHCPSRVMVCGHKVSCLCWSPYLKSQLASSDYEGMIDIWDVTTGQKTLTLNEHKRRAWSVDISQANPTMVASGSDDSTVKVWSLTQKKAIYTLEQKGNVCCAKFAHHNSQYLAVGSADHHISCYDLRYTKTPVHIYKGHKKAVSYVKWMNDNEIISASTDSTLKLWDRESGQCIRTYQGHQNEKNFVGLSVNEDWISCGSESNRLYTYHKQSTLPVATFRFPKQSKEKKKEESEETESEAEEDDEEDDDDSPNFVSSVCWQHGTNRILASNSKGMIKVLEMK
ncbi:WD40-repeat-containing domain protein [Blakeslea trispora]|nr:WD40-repeat-containing domain protein [Blakeslea trispora]